MGHEMKFKCSNLQITETYTPAVGVLQILAPRSTALHDDHKVKQTMPREIASTGKLLGDFVPGVFTGAGHEGSPLPSVSQTPDSREESRCQQKALCSCKWVERHEPLISLGIVRTLPGSEFPAPSQGRSHCGPS